MVKPLTPGWPDFLNRRKTYDDDKKKQDNDAGFASLSDGSGGGFKPTASAV